jgi:hypothetical protein
MPSSWIRHTDDTRFCRKAQTRDSDVTDYYVDGDNEKRDGDGGVDYYHTDDGQKRDDDCTDYYFAGEHKKRGDYCPDSDNDKRHEARTPDGLWLEELD